MYFATFLLKNLVRRKARSLLTILGIAVAIGTVVTLRGVSYGFERSFRANFERRGIDLVVVAAGIPDQLRSNLDEDIGPRIERIEGVRRVSSGLLELVDIERGRQHHQHPGQWLAAGRRPARRSDDRLRPRDPARGFPGDHARRHPRREPPQGCRRHRDDAGRALTTSSASIGASISSRTAARWCPSPRSSVRWSGPGASPGSPWSWSRREDKEALADTVRRRIEALVDAKGKPYGITAQPTRAYVSGTIYIRMANGMAWITSGIALIVGGITILNTMIMAVMERTKEIGILQALGWVRARVLGMVLGEAVLLSLTGATVGIAAAMLVVRWLAGVPQTSGFVSGEISPVVIAEGLGLTLLMSLIGGVGPAYRAAVLQPTEAIRHE